MVWFGVKQDSRAETMARSGSFMYPWGDICSEHAIGTDTSYTNERACIRLLVNNQLVYGLLCVHNFPRLCKATAVSGFVRALSLISVP